MSDQTQEINRPDSKGIEKREQPRCLAFAQKGVRSGSEFAGMMSALMSDLIEGSITPQTGNAVCNAGGKLLKVVELQAKYGKPDPNGNGKELDLIPASDPTQAEEYYA